MTASQVACTECVAGGRREIKMAIEICRTTFRLASVTTRGMLFHSPARQRRGSNIVAKPAANAPVIPTDRVSLERLPEEDLGTEDLVKKAFTDNPQIEQAV